MASLIQCRRKKRFGDYLIFWEGELQCADEVIAFIEANRQIGLEQEKEDVIYIHVTLMPYIYGSNELKSKPTQHSVKELQSMGIKPDILVCRTEQEISDEMKAKIALFCNVRKECVIQNMTADKIVVSGYSTLTLW